MTSQSVGGGGGGATFCAPPLVATQKMLSVETNRIHQKDCYRKGTFCVDRPLINILNAKLVY